MYYIIRLKFLIIVVGLLAIGCQTDTVRIAHFNIKEFSLEKINNVNEEGIGRHPQLLAAASIIQQVKPDILLLQEIDHDYTQKNSDQPDLIGPAQKFLKSYLSQGQNPISYNFIFSAPCNTGILTGLDLNGDGIIAQDSDIHTDQYGADSYGWGTYPGQYSMVLLSRYPIDTITVRTFQNFLWKDLPGNHIPLDFYSAEAINILRLSSKSHWDVPIIINTHRLHMLISHPTPPAFDGPEDRNGRRNFDEIMFWRLYLDKNNLLYDDQAHHGGYSKNNPFIIAGDLNADPGEKAVYDGMNTIKQLIKHPLIQDTKNFLVSEGSAEGWEKDQKYFTAQFSEDRRMRIDYLLLSKSLKVIDGAVFWPHSQKEHQKHKSAETASDHRLIWLDIEIQE
jgi:3-phytase